MLHVVNFFYTHKDKHVQYKDIVLTVMNTRERIASILQHRGEITENDRLFLESYFLPHPKYAEKFDHYANRMMVLLTPQKSPAVHLVKLDGSMVSISTLFARNKKGCCDVTAAFRNAIRQQTQKVISTKNCELCNQALLQDETTHVDHVSPLFYQLLESFRKKCGFDLSSVQLVRDRNRFFHLADTNLREAWESYHATHAHLRIVHAKCNLSRKRKDKTNG